MKQHNFDEYWEAENKLWELSMKESFRQRDERIKRLNKYEDEVNKLKTKIAQRRTYGKINKLG